MRREPSRAGTGSGDPAGSTFMRGLAIGTLVGAVIAGSALWEALQGRLRHGEPAATSGSPDGTGRSRSRPSIPPDGASPDRAI